MRKVFVPVTVLLVLLAVVGGAAAQDPTPDPDSDTLESLREFLGAPQAQAPTPQPPASSSATTLTQHNSGWQSAVRELQGAGIIPEGGTLVFEENRVFGNAVGSGFVPLAANARFNDVVIAGTVVFDSNTTEFESCGMLARATGNTNRLNDFLFVGLGNDNTAFVLDTELPEDESVAVISPPGLDSTTPQHFLAVVVDDTINVYLNGELAIRNFPVTDRNGFYALYLFSNSDTVTDCQVNDMWVYRVSAGAGACEITTSSNVNQRSGPGTNFGVAGQLSPGTVYQATAQARGSDGFTWYQLEDGAYVREDVVQAQGACSSLPQAN
jgi:hypothetical protein